MRQRFVDFIAEFDGFVAAGSFSVLVKVLFVLFADVARFIAKRFESLVARGKLRVDFGGDTDVVDVIEHFVIRYRCFANSQSVLCSIFRKKKEREKESCQLLCIRSVFLNKSSRVKVDSRGGMFRVRIGVRVRVASR